MKTRCWSVAGRTIAAVAATVTLGSCAEKGALPTQANSSLVGVTLVTNIAAQTASAYQIDVKVGYNRTSGAAVILAERKLPVSSSEQQISVTVDIAPCLADPNRGGAPDSCPLSVWVTLLDANANVLDTQSQGPFAAGAGEAPVAVSATLNSQFTLSVATTGAGSGTVQLNPVGNVTGTGGSYARHSSVTLTAVADANSVFGGWSGDCSGSSMACVLTMDANKNVTATFGLSAARFDGNYTGTIAGTERIQSSGGVVVDTTISLNGPISLSVRNGVITIPGVSGQATISASGSATFSNIVTTISYSGFLCTDTLSPFTGVFTVSPQGALAASGSWTASGTCTGSFGGGATTTITYSASGTWSSVGTPP